MVNRRKAGQGQAVSHEGSLSDFDKDAAGKHKELKYEPYNTYLVHEVPEWMRNPFQTKGYRPPHLTPMQCLWTSFQVNNETWNIWTMVAGILINFYVTYLFFSDPRLEALPVPPSATDYAILLMQHWGCLAGGIFALVFHIFQPVSPTVKRHLAALDYFGIFVFAFTSSLPSIYWCLQCHPEVQYPMLACIWVLVIVSVPLSFAQVFRENRVLRLSVFNSALVVAGLFLWVSYRWGVEWRLLEHPTYMFLNFIPRISAGIFFFASRVPERWFPESFDNGWHSHVIWHVLVTYAGTTTMFGHAEMLLDVTQYTCPA